jgi:hypothetical protein
MNKADLIVSNALIRIVGVFETSSKLDATIKRFKTSNYSEEIIKDESSFYKNYWYPEFRDLYFLKKEKSSASILKKSPNEIIEFIVREDKATNERTTLNAKIEDVEIFLFENKLDFFTIDLSIETNSLSGYSDLMYCARSFETKILDNDSILKWVNYIENDILTGIKITSDTQKVKVDEYSGSKFKLYSVIDLKENIEQKIRLELLYDLGSVAKIGSAGGDEYFSPSESYLNQLLKNKITVFNNYDILPLFDSFTVLGTNILTEEKGSFQNTTWSSLYFRIFLHNLYIKYNLFRFNSDMIEDSVKVRDQFEQFLNNYNLSHISYNFLPNTIYQEHRKSLDIDAELSKFQKRINRISQAIQEEKQSRSNLLLGIVGFFTSISSISPILSFVNDIKVKSGFNALLFYGLIVVGLFVIGIPLLIYMFPDKFNKLKRKWSARNNK